VTFLSSFRAAPDSGYGPESWLLDTGASHHMSWERRLFTEYTENTDPNQSVQTANESVCPAGKGTIKVTLVKTDDSEVTVKLTDVIHLPQLGTNLLSGVKMHQKGCSSTAKPRPSGTRTEKNSVSTRRPGPQ